jgi:predicted PurR-regulated permease PerM
MVIIVIAVVVILIPVSFLASVLIKEIPIALEGIRAQSGWWRALTTWLPQLDATVLAEQISQAGSTAGKLLFGTLSVIGNQLVSYVLMFFMLYFLLTADEEKLSKTIFEVMPFDHDNTLKLQLEFKKVTRATIITSGLIALLQGALLALGFIMFGINAPVLWGLVAMVASFIPMFGVSLVWLPAAVLQFFQGDIGAGIGLLAWGAIISSVDNVLRPYIQKKVGQIHPFISILGVIMGLSLFGLVGLIIGPLFLSYFVLMLKMFKEEYINA